MGKTVKKLKDIEPGDQYTVVKTVTQVVKSLDSVELIFDDGSSMKADVASDPAIEIETDE